MKNKVLRRTVLLSLALVFLTCPVAMAGDYDGIWWNPNFDPNSFVSVRQVGGAIVAVLFELNTDAPPTVLIGSLSGTTANMSSYQSIDVTLNLTATFNSATQGSFTVNSCSGDCEGVIPGIPIGIQKLF